MDGALKGGIWLSLALFVILFILSITKTCDWFGCEIRATAFWNSRPNEIGDTLAGIAGALAFLWIIVTVMLQSKELAAQRAELQLTRMEFERMADAQGQQLTLLLEARSGEQFEASLDAVRSFEFELHLL